MLTDLTYLTYLQDLTINEKLAWDSGELIVKQYKNGDIDGSWK